MTARWRLQPPSRRRLRFAAPHPHPTLKRARSADRLIPHVARLHRPDPDGPQDNDRDRIARWKWLSFAQRYFPGSQHLSDDDQWPLCANYRSFANPSANGSRRPLPRVPVAPATEGMPQKAAVGATGSTRQVRTFVAMHDHASMKASGGRQQSPSGLREVMARRGFPPFGGFQSHKFTQPLLCGAVPRSRPSIAGFVVIPFVPGQRSIFKAGREPPDCTDRPIRRPQQLAARVRGWRAAVKNRRRRPALDPNDKTALHSVRILQPLRLSSSRYHTTTFADSDAAALTTVR